MAKTFFMGFTSIPEKLMNQTWKNDKNLILGTILAHLTQIWALSFFYGFYLY